MWRHVWAILLSCWSSRWLSIAVSMCSVSCLRETVSIDRATRSAHSARGMRLGSRRGRDVGLRGVLLAITALRGIDVVLRIVAYGLGLLLRLRKMLWIVLVLLLTRILRAIGGLSWRCWACLDVASLLMLHRPSACAIRIVACLTRILRLSILAREATVLSSARGLLVLRTAEWGLLELTAPSEGHDSDILVRRASRATASSEDSVLERRQHHHSRQADLACCIAEDTLGLRYCRSRVSETPACRTQCSRSTLPVCCPTTSPHVPNAYSRKLNVECVQLLLLQRSGLSGSSVSAEVPR